MRYVCVLAACALLLGGVPVASADSVAVDWVAVQGSANAPGFLAGRSDPTKATDGNATTFFSLGFGGTLAIKFAPAFTDAAVVVEVTGGAYPDEVAEVYVGSDLASLFDAGNLVDTLTRSGGASPNTFLVTLPAGSFTWFGLKDVSDPADFVQYPSADGFDVAEVSVTAVPLPSAAWAGIALLGLLGAARLRKH